MTLNEYMAQNSTSMRDVAAAIGVTYEAIRRYANGERIPKPDILNKITKLTGGAVTANDFYAANNEPDSKGAA